MNYTTEQVPQQEQGLQKTKTEQIFEHQEKQTDVSVLTNVLEKEASNQQPPVENLFDNEQEEQLTNAALDRLAEGKNQNQTLQQNVRKTIENNIDLEGKEANHSVILSKNTHYVLTSRASRRKDRVLKGLVISGQKKEQYEETELKTVVATLIKEKEKNQIAKNAKAHLKQFRRLKEALVNDPVLNTVDKAQILYDFTRSHIFEVEVYRNLYFESLSKGKRQRDIEEVLDRHECLIEYFEKKESGENPDLLLLTNLGLRMGSAHMDYFGKDLQILSRAKTKVRQIDEHAKSPMAAEEQQEKKTFKNSVKNLDDTLTKEQLAGVHTADAWLVELGLESQKRIPFIGRILALSARERLFIYYVIENGQLKNPTMMDLAKSQAAYVPGMKKLRWEMYRVPFRLWEKAGNEGMVSHHWEKLEAALQIVGQPGVIEFIDQFALAQNPQEGQENPPAAVGEQLNEEQQKELNEITNKYGEISTLEERRNAILEQFSKDLETCEQAMNKADSAWIHKDKKKSLAEETLQKVRTTLNELQKADLALSAEIQGVMTRYQPEGEGVGDDFDQAREIASEYKTDRKKTVIKEGLFVSGQALSLLSKIGNIPKLFSQDIGTKSVMAFMMGDQNTFDSIEAKLNGITVATGAITMMRGIHGLVSTTVGVMKLKKELATGDVGIWDAAFQTGQMVYGVGAGLTTIALGGTSIGYAAKTTQMMMGAQKILSPEAFKALEASVNSMKAGVTATTAALSGIGLVMNTGDALLQGKHMIHHTMAAISTNEMIASGKLKGNDEAYMKGILALDLRNKGKQAVGTAFSAATNVGNLAATFLGPAAGLAWGGVSLGLALANRLTDYLLQQRNQKKTAEEFMQLTDLSDLIDDVPDENYIHQVAIGRLTDKKLHIEEKEIEQEIASKKNEIEKKGEPMPDEADLRKLAIVKLTYQKKRELHLEEQEIKEEMARVRKDQASTLKVQSKDIRAVKDSPMKSRAVKESLLNHMSAELGFVTFKSLFSHIVSKYATFLFQNLFYDGQTMIVAGSEDGYPVSGACAQMVKGLGLRVKYPENTTEEAIKHRHPSLQMISAKLGG